MKRYSKVPPAWAALLFGLTFLLVILAGWHREIVSRYPVADLPFVDTDRLKEQVQRGNISKTEALYYRMDYAGADSTEIR